MRKEIAWEEAKILQMKKFKTLKSMISKEIELGKQDDFASKITHHLIICPHPTYNNWDKFYQNIDENIQKIFNVLDKKFFGKNYKRKKRSRSVYVGTIENLDKANPHIHIAVCFHGPEEEVVKLIKKELQENFPLVDVHMKKVEESITGKRHVLDYIYKDYAYNSIIRKQTDLIFSSENFCRKYKNAK